MDAAYAQDLARWIEVQRDARLDLFSDGLLRWQDIFRPVSEAMGSRPHTLVRWFDTNTFFRQPELDGTRQAVRSTDGMRPDESVPRPRVATLPSPYLLSRAAHTSADRNRLMLELTEAALRPAAQVASQAGATLIHLEEPWLGYYGAADQDWAPLGEALGRLKRDLKATVAFHVYFGDAAKYIEQLRRLPVDAVGVDLIETDLNALGTGWDKALVLGILNGRSSVIEPLQETVAAARRIADTVRPSALYLTSSCELSFLPTGVAERKVARLGEAASRVKELVAV